MRVTIEFAGQNHRRYGRPWIAKVESWPVGGKPTLQWGEFLGTVGAGGEAEIEANPGDVVRWGQKDGRGNGTCAYFGIVMTDGTLLDVTESVAKKHYLAKVHP